jgi:site-specific DNA-methyltransferase (adenine-specific)
MEKRIQWKPELKKLSNLRPYDKNPRIITESGLDQLGESFDEIGFAQPININTDGTILSGHARFLKLQNEGAQEVLCMTPDRTLTPKQEEAVIIRMNKNIAGTWDFDVLANEFEIDDLKNWGFQDHDFPQVLDSGDYDDKNKEINTDNFGNDLQHQCPKCGFEFNE